MEIVLLVTRYVQSNLPGLSHTAIVLIIELVTRFGRSMASCCLHKGKLGESVVLQLLLKARPGHGTKSFVIQGALLALR